MGQPERIGNILTLPDIVPESLRNFGPECRCPKCNELLDGVEADNGKAAFLPCEFCYSDEHHEARELQNRIEARRRVAEKWADIAGVGKRYLNCSFDNYEIGNAVNRKRAVEVCRGFAEHYYRYAEKGTWLTLIGPCGTGKSHLAVSIIRYVAEVHGLQSRLIMFSDLMREIKATWSGGIGDKEADIIARCRRVELLVIDEIGVQYDTGTERLVLYALVNGRYEDMLPGVIISNLSFQNLERLVGDRVADRLFDTTGSNKVVVFDWAGYRRR